MIGNLITCARPSCDVEFNKITHNQKYCSGECCRIETNRKIIEKYHERAAIKRGKKRNCRECGTLLSRYNEGKTCSACSDSKHDARAAVVSGLLETVSWT